MDKGTGGTLPAQLWGRVMRRGLEGLPQRPLPGGGELVAQNQQDDSIGGFIGRILQGLTSSEPSASSGAGAHSRPAQRQQDEKPFRSEEHTSELQSLMRISYAVFCLKKQSNYRNCMVMAILHYVTISTTAAS